MNSPRLTQLIENSYDKQNGGIDVNIQSQTSPLFQYLLMNEIKTDITLTAPIEVDDEVINVSAGHGFTAASGEFMVCRNGDSFFQLKVISVSTNAITIESPVDIAYPILGTSIIRGNVNMNVDGSTTAVDFKYTFNNDALATVPVDIQSVIFSFQSGAVAPDDGTFGGIAAITKGLLFRKINGENIGLGNYTSNQEFRDVGAIVEYTEKAPAGTYATNIRINIDQSFGQVIRLDPSEPDSILARVRDDIDALDKFTMSILGSYTRGE